MPTDLPELTDDVLEACARAGHEMNRTFCLATGDYSQLPWDEAPRWQQDSCKAGVHFVWKKGWDTKPGDSHQSWLDHKAADGWKWGPVKDPALREHPSFKPFDQLPKSEQQKDMLFITAVLAMAGAIKEAKG